MNNSIIQTVRRNRPVVFSYAIAILLYLLVMVLVPGFGAGGHVKILIYEISIMAILALGQMFIIISGGIDLSVAWNLNCSAILLTYFSKSENEMLWLLIPLILLVNLAFGLLSGIGVAYVRIPPIIMTLGVNSVLQGALLGLLKGAPGGNAPTALSDFCMGSVGPIPNMLLVFLIFAALATLLLNFSTFGRKLYMCGNSEKVALFSGINVKKTKVAVYAIGAVTSGIGGILLTGRLGQSYLGMGDGYTFPSVIAVVLGGTSLMGGSGNYIGTIAGSVIVIVISGFLSALKMPLPVQQILNGAILIGAVIFMPQSKALRG